MLSRIRTELNEENASEKELKSKIGNVNLDPLPRLTKREGIVKLLVDRGSDRTTWWYE